MNVGLDTSVLVRLLSGDPQDLALVALRYLRERERSGDRVLVSVTFEKASAKLSSVHVLAP